MKNRLNIAALTFITLGFAMAILGKSLIVNRENSRSSSTSKIGQFVFSFYCFGFFRQSPINRSVFH